jgi:two-component system copper resistance phosphate regulon response regulator CusR
MKILIVEDEPKTGDYLKQGLAEAGFVATWRATAGTACTWRCGGEDYDLVILDVMLPGLDGWQVLRGCAAPGGHAGAVPDRARSGGGPGEGPGTGRRRLSGQALRLRRTAGARAHPAAPGRSTLEPTVLRVADLELDLLRRRVTRAGKRIDLTAKEFALLELLLRRQGEVLPRSLIASQVWDMNFDSDTNVIEVAVRRLRAKVDDGFEPKLIRTVRGMGYVLEDRGAGGSLQRHADAPGRRFPPPLRVLLRYCP